MTERDKTDLRRIEPIRPAPDAGVEEPREAADRVGRVTSALTDTPPAVGVEADAERREREADETTSPETEEQLDRLRRG